MRRIPLRLRLTLAFAVGMTAVMFVLGFVLHERFERDLTNGIDMELRSRAQVILAAIARQDPSVILVGGNLIDPDEAFAQVLSPAGRILDTSPGVARAPMLSAGELRSATHDPISVTTRVSGVDDPVRLLAVPTRAAGESLFVVVGSTLGDRNEALARLTLLLAVFGSTALVVLSLGGWLLAGAALQPVERMRQEASAISESELDRRLRLPPADDELSRLGSTLNAMLARLEEAFRREGRFLDQASHELRTPLAVLKMELDLAAAQATDAEEMRAALVSASVEADRLVRLAEDLLVLARIRGGRLPVRRVAVDLPDLIGNVCTAYEARARSAGSTMAWSCDADVVSVDPSRVRQAIEDLLDNALRHGSPPIDISAHAADGLLSIAVRDRGPGFPPEVLAGPFEPFGHASQEDRDEGMGRSGGAGMGLAIVRAVAEAHGGSVVLRNPASGGAMVTLVLRTLPVGPDRTANAPTRRHHLTVILVKQRHANVEYPAEVVSDDGTHIVVQGAWVEEAARDLGFVRFEPGDMFTEHYWRDRWYSVKEVRGNDAVLKGWYCDVARPVRVADGVLISEDLDLDLWVSADRRTILRLDEDDFVASGLESTDHIAAAEARRALDELESLARDGFAGLGSA
jgi:signal transduction histidine kinase